MVNLQPTTQLLSNRCVSKFHATASKILAKKGPLALGRTTLLLIVLTFFLGNGLWAVQRVADEADWSRPNIVLIVADGLGVSDLGCYGNTVLETPHLDRLAASGMKFTSAYSGSPASVPSLGMLMTGQQAGTCSVRVDTGGVPLPADDLTIAEMLKQRGYRTGGFGKWGLGIEKSEGDPLKQGFDEFLGYYHQTHARDHFAEYLIRDGHCQQLPGNLLANISIQDAGFVSAENKITGKQLVWTPEVIMAGARDFIRRNKDQPFFCYLPLTLPHGHLHVPADGAVVESFRTRGWSDWAIAVARMIQHLDNEVGILNRLLQDLHLEKNTILIFCSNRGAAMRFDGELDSAKGWRGAGRSVYEGSLRVPLIVSWQDRIAKESRSGLPVSLSDIFSTLADLSTPSSISTDSTLKLASAISSDARRQSLSFAQTLLGNARQQQRHEFLLWQWAAFNPELMRWHTAMQAVRSSNWKLLRHSDEQPWQLYDIAADPAETSDLAAERPELVTRLEKLFQVNVTPAPAQREALADWNTPFKWANRGQGRLRYASSVENVVEDSEKEFKGVAFAKDAVLLGLSRKRDPTGMIHLNFAWDLKPGRRPVRFVHLCDAKGKIVRQLSGDTAVFAEPERSKTVIDYVAVTPAQMVAVDSVAVGFYDPVRKSAMIANGKAAEKYRLTVWEADVEK